MIEKNNAPQIRFKGFSYEWIRCKVIDFAPLQRGFDLPRSKFVVGGYPVITSNGVNGFHSAYKVEGPGVVTGRSGTIGDVHYINSKYWPHNTTLWVTNFKNNNHLYVYYVYTRFNLSCFATGSGVPTLNRNDVHDKIIFIPRFEEQKKIGEYFQCLDKLIEQKENKFQKLQQFKKSMLSKMFPVNGADTPSIRFNGFRNKWQNEKLGDIAKITTGSSNRQDSGLDGKYTFFDRSEDIRKSDIYLFDCEAIIVAGEGSDFVPKYFVGKFDLHQRTYAVMSYETGDSKFLFYYIHHFRKWFLSQAVGSTVKSLRLPMFQDMLIQFPQKNEQTKIGNYFKKLDKLIDLQQQELEKLKNLKKAFLAKMFV